MKGAYPLSCFLASMPLPLSAANNGVTFITRRRRILVLRGGNGNVEGEDPWENEIKRMQEFYRSNQGQYQYNSRSSGDGGMSDERGDSAAHANSEPNESGDSKDIDNVVEDSIQDIQPEENNSDLLNKSEAAEQPPSDARKNLFVDISNNTDEGSDDGEQGFEVVGSRRSTVEGDDGIQSPPDFANSSEAIKQSIRPNNPIDEPEEDFVEIEGDVYDDAPLQSDQEDEDKKVQSFESMEYFVIEDEITKGDTATNVGDIRAPTRNADGHAVTKFLPSAAFFKNLRHRLRHHTLISYCLTLGGFVLVTTFGSAISAAKMNTSRLNREEEEEDDEKES